MNDPMPTLEELAEMERVCESVSDGWKYGGMMGDPGKPLCHFVEDSRGENVLLSESFNADYANLDKPLKFAVFARTALPRLVRTLRSMLEAASGERMEDSVYDRIMLSILRDTDGEVYNDALSVDRECNRSRARELVLAAELAQVKAENADMLTTMEACPYCCNSKHFDVAKGTPDA